MRDHAWAVFILLLSGATVVAAVEHGFSGIARLAVRGAPTDFVSGLLDQPLLIASLRLLVYLFAVTSASFLLAAPVWRAVRLRVGAPGVSIALDAKWDGAMEELRRVERDQIRAMAFLGESQPSHAPAEARLVAFCGILEDRCRCRRVSLMRCDPHGDWTPLFGLRAPAMEENSAFVTRPAADRVVVAQVIEGATGIRWQLRAEEADAFAYNLVVLLLQVFPGWCKSAWPHHESPPPTVRCPTEPPTD